MLSKKELIPKVNVLTEVLLIKSMICYQVMINQILSHSFDKSMTFCNFFLFQNAETIEKLNESGELRRILKPFKVSNKLSCRSLVQCFNSLAEYRVITLRITGFMDT